MPGARASRPGVAQSPRGRRRCARAGRRMGISPGRCSCLRIVLASFFSSLLVPGLTILGGFFLGSVGLSSRGRVGSRGRQVGMSVRPTPKKASTHSRPIVRRPCKPPTSNQYFTRTTPTCKQSPSMGHPKGPKATLAQALEPSPQITLFRYLNR